MDRLIWIALVVAFVFGLVMVTRRRPPRPPGAGTGAPGASSVKVMHVDLNDRE